HRLLPEPVGMTTSTSRPSIADCTTRSCPGRNWRNPKCSLSFSRNTRGLTACALIHGTPGGHEDKTTPRRRVGRPGGGGACDDSLRGKQTPGRGRAVASPRPEAPFMPGASAVLETVFSTRTRLRHVCD